jgi:uncharacterized repeat protein (TIGR04138 family)
MPPPAPDENQADVSSETVKPTLREVAQMGGDYPVQALEFMQAGLEYTVVKIHGKMVKADRQRHVSGQQLCQGLREYAMCRWGMMARTVLGRWGIHSTLDFGRIVFLLVHAGLLKTTDHDSLSDFRDVFDFAAFESEYRIEIKA